MNCLEDTRGSINVELRKRSCEDRCMNCLSIVSKWSFLAFGLYEKIRYLHTVTYRLIAR
jgi:hypothetical protein